jgi:hypothetical protein
VLGTPFGAELLLGGGKVDLVAEILLDHGDERGADVASLAGLDQLLLERLLLRLERADL